MCVREKERERRKEKRKTLLYSVQLYAEFSPLHAYGLYNDGGVLLVSDL